MSKILKSLVSNNIAELLVYPPYLYFSLSVFFSQVAFNMLNAVLIFLVFHLTSSNFAVSMLLFAILIPQILISFLGGVIADSGNKKLILVLGNAIRAIVLVVLFFNFNSLALVYAVTLVISIITQFYVPAESPLIPHLVPKERLVAANSIFGISFFGSILVGYVIAGPAIGIFGRDNAFLIVSILFFFATLFASLIPDHKIFVSEKIKPEDISRSIRTEFSDSFNILKKTREISDGFFLLVSSQIIIFILATLIPGYAKNILQVPAEDVSLILFAPASLGMLISAFLIGTKFHNTSFEKLTGIGIYISGLTLILLPFTSRIISQSITGALNFLLPSAFELNILNFVIAIAFFAGFANALIFVPSQALIQSSVPENFRSKIYGLLFALIGVFSLLPILVAGGVADIVGVGAVLFSIGALILVMGLIRHNVIRLLVNQLKK